MANAIMVLPDLKKRCASWQGEAEAERSPYRMIPPTETYIHVSELNHFAGVERLTSRQAFGFACESYQTAIAPILFGLDTVNRNDSFPSQLQVPFGSLSQEVDATRFSTRLRNLYQIIVATDPQKPTPARENNAYWV